ncbi:MAG: transposase [Actinomycetota bacterium]|nr:transposase [Actinomycetota bacterium]
MALLATPKYVLRRNCGLRFPFTRFTSNAAWLEIMLVAALLLGATQQLLLDGHLAVAEPRRLRHTLLHAAARIATRSRQTWLRLADNWPWTPQLLVAYRRLAALQPTPG